jgi:ABC-type glycerol-3-phosphate transport system substrate-binding protein
MKKRTLSLFLALLLATTMAIQAMAAATTTKLIPTNIPKSFPVVKMDPSFTLINFWSSTGSQNAAVDNLVNWFNATTGKQKKIYVKNVYQGAYTDIATKVQATVAARDLKNLPG